MKRNNRGATMTRITNLTD